MKVALHICCAVCAAGAAERLIREGYQVCGYFFNPNIHPADEYYRRLESARIVAEQLGFPLTTGCYEPDTWHSLVTGLENEPEGGQRCLLCFKMRLEKTFAFMRESGCEVFTSTLTMGANKPARLIAPIGHSIGGETFLECDFKKKDGFKRAGELSRLWGLYRQTYCGCIYSLKDKQS